MFAQVGRMLSPDSEVHFSKNAGISCFVWVSLGSKVSKWPHRKISRFGDLARFRVRSLETKETLHLSLLTPR